MEELPLVLEWVRAHNFAVFTAGDYNVNLVALRTPQKPDATPASENRFNDRFFCVFKKRGQWISRAWVCTSDPGFYYQRFPMNPRGCGAIYAPQQVRGGYRLGLHRGKSKALVQSSTVARGSQLRVYRDDDRSGVFDFDSSTVEVGYGFNVHKGPLTEAAEGSVDRASAGCIVFQKSREFDTLIKICTKSAAQYGNSFSLTILDAPDLSR
jgi:hypothetical protein